MRPDAPWEVRTLSENAVEPSVTRPETEPDERQRQALFDQPATQGHKEARTALERFREQPPADGN